MIPNYVYFGGVYLIYLWSGVNYSDSSRSYWNARVAHTSEPAEKKSLLVVLGRLWLTTLQLILMEKPGLCGLHRNLQLQENADEQCS
jgi:hypothetical protein